MDKYYFLLTKKVEKEFIRFYLNFYSIVLCWLGAREKFLIISTIIIYNLVY